MSERYAIIGAGPAGLAGALQADELGRFGARALDRPLDGAAGMRLAVEADEDSHSGRAASRP